MSRGTLAVIFDLDGTLLDTIADIAHAMNSVLAHRGLPPHPDDAYRKMVGWGLRELASRALPEGHDIDEAASELHAAYHADPVSRATVYPGVHRLMSELSGHGVPTSVLSNKADDLVQTIVSTFFPDASFVSVRGLREGVPAKPDPESAIQTLQEMNVSADRAIYLGDSDVDVQTARRAGMIAVGAAWGFRGREELMQAGADIVIDEPGELMAVIREKERA